MSKELFERHFAAKKEIIALFEKKKADAITQIRKIKKDIDDMEEISQQRFMELVKTDIAAMTPEEKSAYYEAASEALADHLINVLEKR